MRGMSATTGRTITGLDHLYQAATLLANLPAHLADMAQFSLETGLRRANVTGLQWSQVDLARRMAWIHPDQAKARKAIPVPLSEAAIEVPSAPDRQKAGRGQH